MKMLHDSFKYLWILLLIFVDGFGCSTLTIRFHIRTRIVVTLSCVLLLAAHKKALVAFLNALTDEKFNTMQVPGKLSRK